MAVAIRETEVAGERFMRMADALLVASKSTPGTWYRVDSAHCECLGFKARGHCRHIAAALKLETEQTTERVVVEWSEQFSAWLVRWVGHIHGGCHFNRMEADAHATELRNDPHWGEWLAMHEYGAPHPTARPALHLVEVS